MAPLIHILHLEDDPVDAELIRAKLEQADLESRITLVQTQDEFEQHLEQGTIDIILGDVRLPAYDGMSALRVTLARRSEIPFIFVSGTMGEEAAIEALTQGATDYVLKQNLSRLAPAVQRALLEAKNLRERRQAERALAESETKLRSILDNIGAGVSLISPEMKILELNKQMREWFPHIDTGQQPYCYQSFNTPPRQQVCSYCPTIKTLQDGLVHEAITQTPQGEQIRNYRVVATPLHNAAGELIAAIEMVDDITETRQAQEALTNSNNLLRAIIEAAPVAIIGLDLDGHVQSVWNPAAERMLGWSAQEVMGKPLPSVTTDKKNEFRQFREQVGQGMALDGVEVRRQRRDGTPIDYSIYASPLNDAQGNIAGNIAVLVDITERKQAAQRLALLSFALNSIHEAAFMIDENAHFKYVNDEACRILGYSREELLSMGPPDINSDISMERWPGHWNTLKARGSMTFEGNLKTRHGRLIPVEINANYFEYGGQAYDLGLVRDITERKAAESRLNDQLHFLQQMLDAIPIPVSYKDREGVYLGCNAAFEGFAGLTKKDIVGKTVHDVVDNERADQHAAADAALIAQPGVKRYEVSGIYQDGEYRDVVFHKATFVDADDRVAGTVGAVVDITERKAAVRERLANLWYFESMDRVNRAIQATDDLEVMMKDVLDVVLSIFGSDRAFLMYPCDPEARTWSSPMECNTPEYPGVWELKREMPMDPQVAETLRILLNADHPVAFGPGTPHALPGDVAKQFGIKSFLSMAIHPKTGSPWQFGIHQCTEARIWTAEEMRLFESIGRRLADSLTSLLSYRELRQSEEFLDNIVEHIPDMIFVKDAVHLRFVRFNRAGEQLVGYPREALLGKTDHDFFAKEEADFFTAKDRQVIEGRALVDIPEEIIHGKNNTQRILHTKKIPILDESGAPQYLLGISEDITQRKQAEASIRKLSQAIEQSPVSIVITDTKGTIEFVNAKFTQVTGYSLAEALGQNPRILKSGETPVAEYRRLWQTIGLGEVWQGEFKNRKKNGELFWEQATIAPVRDAGGDITHYVAVKEDISERKKLEEQLRQVQKMEAIGQLAGGIAHDFNNILSAITGFTELSLASVDGQSDVGGYLTHVLEAGNRAKELINQILMFSRETAQELRPIQIAFPVKEALKLIRASLPATIEIRAKLLSKASAMADPTQVHQIVMNLCTNAAHAMREKGGLLEVHLTDITIDHGERRKDYPDAKPGDYIRLTVADQGHGIDAHYLHRIFDPFFTTKKAGEGTGMGLSVIHGIVTSYGGFIYARSQLGRGSRFDILIPAQKSAVTRDAVRDLPIPRGSESILFVDDETMIVDIVKHMLQSLGYHVTARTSPIEAWEAFRSNPDSFDLVVTDMAMPKMSGLDLAEKIQRLRPGVPIVLCTGFNLEMNQEKLAEHGFQDLIHKPILRRDMAMAIRKTLDRHASTTVDDKVK